ncbi:MAG: hypothetical protein LW716_16895 [Microcystis sp. 53602_E8]|jgi:hypothetical protein|nr:hypothetical protein [Microcystis sp. 53602_E8]
MPNPVILHTYEKRYNSKMIFKVKKGLGEWGSGEVGEWGEEEKKAENSHLITDY